MLNFHRLHKIDVNCIIQTLIINHQLIQLIRDFRLCYIRRNTSRVDILLVLYAYKGMKEYLLKNNEVKIVYTYNLAPMDNY